MKAEKVVVGIYTYVDDTVSAINFAKTNNLKYEVYMPTYVPEVAHAISDKRSHVAKISLTGAITGLTAGFALAILCSLDWPMRVSAKAIVSIPGFVVIGYEWTILFGALFTLLGIFLLCRLPNPFKKVGYDSRFSNDKFGVVLSCGNNEADRYKQELIKTGADEVLVKEGL
mgnify:CR=1 FL=1